VLWVSAYSHLINIEGNESADFLSGQGYLIISGFPDIVAAVTATATFEGENYVLWQQVTRILFKCLDNLKLGKSIDPRMTYLRDGGLGNTIEARDREFLALDVQLTVYRQRALRLVFRTYHGVRSSSKSPADAWNEHMLSIIGAARAHIEYLVLSAFVNTVRDLPPTASPALRSVLTKLCALFALSNIINPATVNTISFAEDGYLSSRQLNTIRSLVNELLDQLLPDVIALTDAWDFTDASLCSALGMYDGNVYENIMNWVKQLPINQRAWKENKGVYQPGWRKWVEPVLQAKL
jgi:acyl-CoA oxidase